MTKKAKFAFTLAKGGHSPLLNGDGSRRLLLCGDEGAWSSPRLVKRGFTLAEVLITLGVIGVVAVVTMPTLVQHYKKQTTSARLKKFYSTIQQAILRSEIDNGLSKYWEFSPMVLNNEGNYDYDKNLPNTYNFVNKYITPYMNYNKITEGSYTPATETEEEAFENVRLYLSDGSTVKFFLGNCLDIRYDVNGDTLPNYSGQDIFWFLLCFPPEPPARLGFQTYNKYRYSDRNQALEACKSSRATCSVLLQYDNWEFKDDYPYKL